MKTNFVLTIGSAIIIIMAVIAVTFLALNEIEIPNIMLVIITSALGFLGGLKIPSDPKNDI